MHVDPGADATRREVLGAIAATGAVALPGCGAITGDDGGSEKNAGPAWAQWAPEALVSDVEEAEVARFDVDRLREEFPGQTGVLANFSRIESRLGLSENALDRMIQVDESASSIHSVLLGDIDPDDVQSALGFEVDDAYEGYDVLDGQFAVSDGVLISSDSYETLVDAKAGETERLVERGGQWPAAIENASGGALGSVEPAPNGAWEVQAITASGTDDGAMQLTAYAHFISAEAAEANRDAVRRALTENTEEDVSYEVQSVTVDGSVVVLKGTRSDVSL